ncbi:hypothetical protein N7508_009648 [Penicillium antarcticum]|uniref:uncharacterized protein n=1 Tax=Penicillium antarcticum TaxID=416450 RepID=UPI002385B5F4|nr:uncharacterized protein N7508_009648 [Penicillium antarcticum]KAJ5294827.1 hypothetical protein N7508_009648 [Penicillium antarcticum]
MATGHSARGLSLISESCQENWGNDIDPQTNLPGAIVQMPSRGVGVIFRICAVAVDLYIDRSFWDMWNFVVNVGPTRSVHWCWDVVLRDDVASPVIGSDPVPPAQLSSVTLETGNFEHTAEAPEAEASASDGAGDDSSPLAVAGPVMLLPICLIVCETILCAAASLDSLV